MSELIRAFRRGDEAAVRELYQQFGGAVTTVARSIVGPQNDLVEEVVQQTFLKAWRSADSFDESREFAPWLYAIARRTAIDVVRRERRPTTGDHEPETDIAVTHAGIEEAYEAFEVRQAIDALPDDERRVVEMSHRFGLTHREIAEQLDVPIGTVKSRSARAHGRLATALRHLSPAVGIGTFANQKEESNVQPGKEL